MPDMAEPCNLPSTQLFLRRDPPLSIFKCERMNYLYTGKKTHWTEENVTWLFTYKDFWKQFSKLYESEGIRLGQQDRETKRFRSKSWFFCEEGGSGVGGRFCGVLGALCCPRSREVPQCKCTGGLDRLHPFNLSVYKDLSNVWKRKLG